nr:MAG TPA: hypothetical protein [Caudoviricetes sp.]
MISTGRYLIMKTVKGNKRKQFRHRQTFVSSKSRDHA